MGMNEGILYKVTTTKKKVTLLPIFALPGCPLSMDVTKENKLIINTVGGLLVFSTLDQFKYFSEKPEKEPEEAILPELK